METIYEHSRLLHEQRNAWKSNRMNTTKDYEHIDIFDYVDKLVTANEICEYKNDILNYEYYHNLYPYTRINNELLQIIEKIESKLNIESFNPIPQININEKRNMCLDMFEKSIEKIIELNLIICDIKLNLNHHDDGKYGSIFIFICKYKHNLLILNYRIEYYSDLKRINKSSGLFLKKIYNLNIREKICCKCNLFIKNQKFIDVLNYLQSDSYFDYINVYYKCILKLDELIMSKFLIKNNINLGNYENKYLHFDRINDSVSYLVRGKSDKYLFIVHPFVIENIINLHLSKINDNLNEFEVTICLSNINEIPDVFEKYYTFVTRQYGYLYKNKYYNHYYISDLLNKTFKDRKYKLKIIDLFDIFLETSCVIDTLITYVPVIKKNDYLLSSYSKYEFPVNVDVYDIRIQYDPNENDDKCVMNIVGYYYDSTLISYKYNKNEVINDANIYNNFCDHKVIDNLEICMDVLINFIKKINDINLYM